MRFTALPTDIVRNWQSGGPDAHGQVPEHAISNGDGTPCRHCLRNVAKGEPYLILAHRPFDELQPYAECGPIFVCAAQCPRHAQDGSMPEVLQSSPDYLIKGYSSNERIVYGTGAIVPASEVKARAHDIFAAPDIAFIHIRSARNNCYQARIDRD